MDNKTANQLQQIGIQLVRNGICHGIETTAIRLAKGKPAQGEITLSVNISPEDVMYFVVHDDGQSIAPSRIRAAMIISGRYTKDVVNQLSDKDIVKKLFESGFTTANFADKDAGRGVGMDLVQSLVNNLGGELKIDTKPDQYTQFTFRISQYAAINLEAAETTT